VSVCKNKITDHHFNKCCGFSGELLWAFAQLGAFSGYEAKQAGVAFVEVDPAYTSQTCKACGWAGQT